MRRSFVENGRPNRWNEAECRQERTAAEPSPYSPLHHLPLVTFAMVRQSRSARLQTIFEIERDKHIARPRKSRKPVSQEYRGYRMTAFSILFGRVTCINVTVLYDRVRYIGLATKWLRILSLGGIDKIRNHLVAKPTYLLVIKSNTQGSLLHKDRVLLVSKMQWLVHCTCQFHIPSSQAICYSESSSGNSNRLARTRNALSFLRILRK